jgi:hypothetical protein
VKYPYVFGNNTNVFRDFKGYGAHFTSGAILHNNIAVTVEQQGNKYLEGLTKRKVNLQNLFKLIWPGAFVPDRKECFIDIGRLKEASGRYTLPLRAQLIQIVCSMYERNPNS